MKSRMKKILGLIVFLCLFAFTGKAVLTSYAESSGKYGDNLTWTLSDDGTLTISGTGPMKDLDSSENPPWEADREKITKAVIEDGVTSLGDYAFKGCSNLISVSIPKTAGALNGDYPFEGCTNLESVTIFAHAPSFIQTDYLKFHSWPALKDIYFIGWRENIHRNIMNILTSTRAHNFVYVSAECDENCGTVRDSGMWVVNDSDLLDPGKTEITIQAIPEEGYVFAGWERNGQLVSTENPWNSTFSEMRNYQDGEEYPCYLELKAIFRKELTITAKDQEYAYNGTEQGESNTVYDTAAQIDKKVKAEGLKAGDYLYSIKLNGKAAGTGTHEGLIEPSYAVIKDADGNVVTGNYEISYLNGNLTITGEAPAHVHALVLVAAKDATCTEDGNKDYYKCSLCGKWFEDLTANFEIKDKSSVIIPAGHKLTKVELREPTCAEDGNRNYFICDACGRWFSDHMGRAPIEDGDKYKWIIPAFGHDWDGGVVTKEPSYTEEGILTYTCRRDSRHKMNVVIPKKQGQSSGGSDRDEFTETHEYSFSYAQDGHSWYCRDKGTLLKDNWAYVPYNGRTYWYHFDGEGRMQTGWLTVNGSTYYLWAESDGWMGRMVTGYQEIGGKPYYFETEEGKGQGRMVIVAGYRMIGGKTYYFETEADGSQGRMYRNEWTPDGYWAGPDGSFSMIEEGRTAGTGGITPADTGAAVAAAN